MTTLLLLLLVLQLAGVNATLWMVLCELRELRRVAAASLGEYLDSSEHAEVEREP